jgi:hypothetical protein
MTVYPSPSSGIVSLNVAAPPRLRVDRPVQEGLPRHTHELGIEHALIRPTPHHGDRPGGSQPARVRRWPRVDPPKVDLIEVVAALLTAAKGIRP